jgi:TonB family protein
MELISWLGNVKLADWILNVGVQSTIILTISLFLRRVCRKFSSPIRSSICFMTMIVLLVLPIASFVSSDLSVMRINVSRSTTSIAGQMPGQVVHQQELSIQERMQQLSIYGINLGGTIWLFGTLFMAARLGYGLYYTRKAVSGLPRLKHDRLLPTIDAVKGVFGRDNLPEIYASMAAKSPQTVGLFTPCIIFPPDLCEKTNEEELRSILIHEMSHIFHKDQWAGLLQRLIGTFFWWNPLTRGLSTDFSNEREYVCDMYVNRHGNPRAFANCLLHLARDAQSVKGLPTALCAITSIGFLEKRIHKILSGGRIMKTRLSTTTSLVHVLISIIVAGLLFSVNLTMADQASTAAPDGEENTTMGYYSIDEVDTPPRIVTSLPPQYPYEAKMNHISGRVNVQFVVDTDGNAWEAEVVEADPEGIFEQSVLDAIVQYEFEPATKNGQTVPCIATMPIIFSLE